MKYAGITDIGIKRKFNQDSFIAKDNLFVVADGMGGHNGGDTASQIATSLFAECEIGENPESTLKEIIEKANKAIRDRAFSEPELEGMGTTIVACFIDGENEACIANVGDSRAYKVENGKLKRITVDHSVVQELIERGMITEEEAKTHPQRNVITRAVGSDSSVLVDIFKEKLNEGDKLLLCSDGLTTMVDESKISEILVQGEDTEAKVQKLVDTANEAGGNDNITVLLIEL